MRIRRFALSWKGRPSFNRVEQIHLGDITNLGLTLAEAKLLLAQVQQQLVAEQVNIHGTFRPDGRTAGRAAGYVR
jgi:hypothetical protein